jgi:MFS family permease
MFNSYVPLARNRDFLIASAGRCVSAFGDEIALIALTLRLQAAGARPAAIAVLLGAGLLPFVVLARLVGRVVDRFDSRRILVVASAAQVACCLPLIFAHQAGVIAALVFLLGTAAAFSQATWQALIPRVVGEERLAPAISVVQSGTTVAAIAAAALGGVLSAAFGTHVPLVVDAVTFAAMGVAAMIVRTRRLVPVTAASGIVDPAESRPNGEAGASAATVAKPRDRRGGWAVLRSDPLLAPLVIGLAAFVLLAMMVNIAQVFLVRETLHASSAWYGGLEAAWMIGVVGGALGAGQLSDDGTRARAVLIGAALTSAALLSFGVAPNIMVLAPLSLLGGAGNGLINSGVATLVMARTPEHGRGRVAATLSAVLNGASVASLAAGGLLASVLSPRQVYGLAGGLGLLVSGVLARRVAAAAAPAHGRPRRGPERAGRRPPPGMLAARLVRPPRNRVPGQPGGWRSIPGCRHRARESTGWGQRR